MNALVAYYSMTGTTKRVAEGLSQYLASKGHRVALERISPKSGYSKLKAYTLGAMQARRRKIIELNPQKSNPPDFDLIAVFTPTWAWTCSPPAYSFVSLLDKARKGQKAIAVSTNGGSPGNGAETLSKTLKQKGFEVLASFTVGATQTGEKQLAGLFQKKLRV